MKNVLVEVSHDGAEIVEAATLEEFTYDEAGGKAGDEAGGDCDTTVDEGDATTGEDDAATDEDDATADEDDETADEADETADDSGETSAAGAAAADDVPKISFCAPVVMYQTRFQWQPKHGNLTILEPAIAVVRRALRTAALVGAVNHDVISLSLVPDYDLLGALSTCTLVLLAPDGRLGSGNRGSGSSAGDHALESLHVNVRLAASIRNLEDIVI